MEAEESREQKINIKVLLSKDKTFAVSLIFFFFFGMEKTSKLQ